MSRQAAKRRARRIIPVIAVSILVTSTLVLLAARPDSPAVTSLEEQLRGQVDTATGEPRPGRDPAAQNQSSLASAASSPSGAGQRVNKPAAGTTGDHSHHHSYHDSSAQTGIGTNGCYVDYGKPGEQCLPAHAATNGSLTCEGVRKYFPRGLVVSGNDRFHLDKNHDGLACGAGD